MKELTTEEKASRYDEAIKRAKAIYQGSYKPDTAATIAETLQNVFPELKESEDEKMRAMAIKAVYAPDAQSCIKSWGINPDDVIAWLEKQGKHADFISKIQVGDKVTRNEDGVLVNLSQLNRVAKPADKVEPIVFRDFNSIFSKEQVEKVDKQVEKSQRLYNAKLRDAMRKAEDFPMTD